MPVANIAIITGNARTIEGFIVNLKPAILAIVSTQDTIWDLI
jgi:hypothetical protein